MLTKKPEIKNIGNRITYKLLRNIILDINLTDTDTIILNSKNFDNIVLDYRDYYKGSMIFPHLLLGVLIREADGENIPQNKVGILKNDEGSLRISDDLESDYFDGKIIYHCGWCGNVVDESGKELGAFDRNKAINNLQNHENSIVKKTNGKCCPNGNE